MPPELLLCYCSHFLHFWRFWQLWLLQLQPKCANVLANSSINSERGRVSLKNWFNFSKTPYMKNGNPNFSGIPKNCKDFWFFPMNDQIAWFICPKKRESDFHKIAKMHLRPFTQKQAHTHTYAHTHTRAQLQHTHSLAPKIVGFGRLHSFIQR